MARSSYLIPPFGSPGDEVQGYMLEAVSEGEAWLKSQRNSADWDRIRDILSPADPAMDLEGESNTGYNKVNRIFRDLTASLTNFTYEGAYHADHDPKLYERAHLLTKRDRVWFRQAFAHAKIRSAIQYAIAFGTGYLIQDWDKDYWGPNRGDVRLTAMPPDAITVVQLPSDHDLQRAYMVLIRYELPINLARRIYSYNAAFAHALTPDRETPGWFQKGLRKVQQLIGGGSPIFRFAGSDRAPAGSFPTVDIFHAYTLDSSLNNSGQTVQIGPRGANWTYDVPSIGAMLPSGQDKDGLPLLRQVTDADATMFPLRRLTIFSRSVNFPCYDNSSPWWHGQVPVVKFAFNDKAWQPLGQSLLGDVATMQTGVVGIMRNIEDSSNARMDPPLGYDEQKVSKAFAETVNPRRGGIRVAVDLQQGDIFKVLGESWQYEVPQWIPEYLKAQEARMDYLAGVPDLIAIAKAKQVPSADSMEKLLEMAGPLVQDMIRAIEVPFYQLGEQRKSHYLQFDSRERLLQLFGGLGDLEEEVRYSPDLIVPVMPGETVSATRDRAKLYLHEFQYHVTQTGMNEIHRMATKLAYLQLAKVMPISWWTLAKVWQVPNFGPVPTAEDGTECKNELELWVAQKHLEQEMAQESAAGMPGAGGPGRPPTNRKPPTIRTKSGGTRSTVTTS